jgi:hypothetical protein
MQTGADVRVSSTVVLDSEGNSILRHQLKPK